MRFGDLAHEAHLGIKPAQRFWRSAAAYILLPATAGMASILLYGVGISWLKSFVFESKPQFGERSFATMPDLERLLTLGVEGFERILPGWIYLHNPSLAFGFSILLIGALTVFLLQHFLAATRESFTCVGWGSLAFITASTPLLSLLVVDHDTQPWRLFASAYAGFMVLVLSLSYSRVVAWSGYVQVFRGFFLLGLMASCFLGFFEFQKGLIRPNVREAAAMKVALLENSPVPNEVYFAGVPRWWELLPGKRYEYSSIPSGMGGWFSKKALNAHLANVFGREAWAEIKLVMTIPCQPPVPLSAEVTAMTLEGALGPLFEVAPPDAGKLSENHPFFGEVLKLDENVYYSRSLGYLVYFWQGWFFNPSHGFIQPKQKKADRVRVLTTDQGEILLNLPANSDFPTKGQL